MVAEGRRTAPPGLPEAEVRARRDLVRGVERAAPLLSTNPARCRAMVNTAIRRHDAARVEEETEARSSYTVREKRIGRLGTLVPTCPQ